MEDTMSPRCIFYHFFFVLHLFSYGFKCIRLLDIYLVNSRAATHSRSCSYIGPADRAGLPLRQRDTQLLLLAQSLSQSALSQASCSHELRHYSLSLLSLALFSWFPCPLLQLEGEKLLSLSVIFQGYLKLHLNRPSIHRLYPLPPALRLQGSDADYPCGLFIYFFIYF